MDGSKTWHFLPPLDINKNRLKINQMYPNIFLQFLHDHLNFETDKIANFSQKTVTYTYFIQFGSGTALEALRCSCINNNNK